MYYVICVLAGAYVLVGYFAWCHFCVREMQKMEEIRRRISK